MEGIRCSCSYRYNRLHQPFNHRLFTRRQCLFILFILLILQPFLFNYSFYLYRSKTTDDDMKVVNDDPNNVESMERDSLGSNLTENKNLSYKYPMIDSTVAIMDFNSYNGSSYNWFMSKKAKFVNAVVARAAFRLPQPPSAMVAVSATAGTVAQILQENRTGTLIYDKPGKEEIRTYSKDTDVCFINKSLLGPIKVNKADLDFHWVEDQHPELKAGYFAPPRCRSQYKVAIFIPYRDRKENLSILLYYLHGLLKKQLLEYRVFVIEQYGTGMWNKGTLYNIAYLESQRFGTWDCLIFHDVDTVPEHEGIIYGCDNTPMHLAAAIEALNYTIFYKRIFGGVTVLSPHQYEKVNGYSNIYWNWGAEDDDIAIRLRYENYTVSRFNGSIARYATLPHKRNERGSLRFTLMDLAHRYKTYKVEGLKTTQYKLISVTKKRLYTHLLADVNPNNIKLTSKSRIVQLLRMRGKTMVIHTLVSRLIRYHRFFWNRGIILDMSKRQNHTKTLRISSARLKM